MRALVAKRDWDEIAEVAKNKRSPIGWEVSLKITLETPNPKAKRKDPLGLPLLTDENLLCSMQPFFNLTLQAGNPRLAATFVPKCAGSVEAGETVTMYEKCGMRVKAAEEAVRLKDREAFEKVLEGAGRGTQEGREIERVGAAAFK